MDALMEQAPTLLEIAGSVLGELDVQVVVDRMLESARALTGAKHSALGVLNPMTAVLGEPSRSSGLPSEQLAMHSFLEVPILVRGVPFGSLHLSEKAGGADFTDADEESAVALAGFAGLAIDHARRYTGAAKSRDELTRTVAALEATTDIARAVGGETDLEVILHLVAKRGRALVSAGSLLIELMDDDELIVAAAAGDRPEGIIGARIALADTVTSAAVRTGSTQRLDVEPNRSRFDQHGLGRLGVSADAGLVVPLVFHNHTYGVLVALDRLNGGPGFTTEDQRLLEAFATSAATAVATATSTASELHRQRLAAAEAERGRWARELHDETLQSLASLRLSLSAARRTGGLDALSGAVGSAIQSLDDGISNLRALVTELRPAALDELGLEAALDALADRSRLHGLEIDSCVELTSEHGLELTRPGSELETAIYRIVQEALTNASKHGNAKRAVVEVHQNQSTVELSVRDDGDGFDPARSTNGFGLLGMRERVQLLHGTAQINSAPGDGTTLTASFPVGPRPEHLAASR